MTMAPEHKPRSKTADTEESAAGFVSSRQRERRGNAERALPLGRTLNTVCQRRPGAGEPELLLPLNAGEPVERRSGSSRFMLINFRVGQAAVNSNTSLRGLALVLKAPDCLVGKTLVPYRKVREETMARRVFSFLFFIYLFD